MSNKQTKPDFFEKNTQRMFNFKLQTIFTLFLAVSVCARVCMEVEFIAQIELNRHTYSQTYWR